MKTGSMIAVVYAVASFSLSSFAADAPKLHSVFTDNMVLQRDIQVPVWGTAASGEKIAISFSGQKKETVADDHGKWSVRLDPMTSSAVPQSLEVAFGGKKLEVKNVLVGDVWICSGQSNMEFGLARSMDGKNELARADYPTIRLFKVAKKIADTPNVDLRGEWVPCSPKVVWAFSAVGYFFGRELHRTQNVPIGLINSSWDGTPAESWTHWKTIETTPGLEGVITSYNAWVKGYPAHREKWEKMLAEWEKLYAGKKEGDVLGDGKIVPRKPVIPSLSPESPNCPARLYNGMITPLVPYAIKGAIWYQGESNCGRALQYRILLPAMIKDWRTAWGQGDFPFLIVQLANFRAVKPVPAESDWAELREAQYLTAKTVPNAGLAVAIDLGDANDIHPNNKQDVGARLALAARKIAYGEKNLVASGPVYKSMSVKDGRAMLKFANVGGGLVARDGDLKTFAIAGADKKFAWAKARIEDDSVVVWNEDVKDPVAVRYAWADNPEGCNLYNKEGLPAVPFRTDAPAEKK